jgi:hypothetical protein
MTQPYSDAPTPPPPPTPTPSHRSGGPGMSELRALPPFDLGVLVTGVLIFIASFFPWYGYSTSGATVGGVKLGGTSGSITAWHSYSTLGLLLLLLATIVAAVAMLAPSAAPQLPVGLRWVAAALSVLGGLLYVIRLFSLSHKSINVFGLKASYGVRWGGWVLLVFVLANVVCCVVSALHSDEPVPWQQGGGTPAPPPAPPAA